jgi:hypothetical protein
VAENAVDSLPMSNDQPLTFEDIRAEELEALRPSAPLKTGNQPEPAAKTETPLSALCISGGGIRSATFALGALQGLTEKGVLPAFDYLSTVSGGGYIGSWLTAWSQRRGGLSNIIPELLSAAPPPKDGTPHPVQHLREYNNYLSPKLGLLSADAWTLVATVTRNMILNWLVLVPLLLVVLMVPRFVMSVAMYGEYLGAHFCGTWIDKVVSVGISGFGGLLFAIATFNTLRYLPGIGNRDHTEAQFLRNLLLPLLGSATAFATLYSWFYSSHLPISANCGHVAARPFWHFWLWAVGSCTASWIAYLIFCRDNTTEGKSEPVGGLTMAILLTGTSTAFGAWWLVTRVYSHVGWPTYVVVGSPLVILAFMGAVTLVVGVTSNFLGDDDREWLSRAGAWLMLFIVVWSALAWLVLLAPEWILALGKWGRSALVAAGAGGGWLSALGGLSDKTRALSKAGKEAAQKDSRVLNLVSHLAALVFIVVFLGGLTLLTNWLLAATGLVRHHWIHHWSDHRALLEHTPARAVVLLTLLFAGIGWLMGRYININRFSLHAMYRNRLIRAYLGASNTGHRNRFTGFDDTDNLYMARLDPRLKPFHVVNVTLNLVSDKRLAWQQRKAESFTISPLHCGNCDVGYRPSSGYGGDQGITLGTAATISGAAASPNMGYHSSPLIGFIMTLFNARLGAWLGNPGLRGGSSWRKPGPTSAVGSLVREAFGLTNDISRWVYLSDGGHFENLGLYEMVKRRCKYIVVFDSGCDAGFNYEDLGNALRKIRIDMGIDIDFGDAMKPLREKQRRCALAEIKYKDVDRSLENGQLLYIKPIMLNNEPPDVYTYYAVNKDFPHQSTADQWFDESQTESYRMLGLHSVHDILRDWEGPRQFDDLMAYVRKTYLGLAGTKATGMGAGS